MKSFIRASRSDYIPMDVHAANVTAILPATASISNQFI